MTSLIPVLTTLLRRVVLLTAVVRGAVRRRVRGAAEAGMTTAEYAVGTVAAVAFAAVLYKVVRSPAVQSALSSVISGALNVHL